MAFFTQGTGEFRVFGINLQKILELMDLREENTLATWFSSIVFLLVAAAFVPLGWSTSSQFTISLWTRKIFQLTAIGACLLSADEVASVHETVGGWLSRIVNHLAGIPLDTRGFSWLLPFIPIALTGLFLLIYPLRRLILQLSIDAWQKKQLQFALWLAVLALPSVFLCEFLEAYFSYYYHKSTIFNCFEESFEIVGMYCLFLCAVLITEKYEL